MSIRIRKANPADAGLMARVHIDSMRTTYKGIMPDEYLASLSYGGRESRWVQILTADRAPASNLVAETDGGEIVGFAGGGPEREGDSTYRGELYAIYLLEEHQRKGLGRRLVSAFARQLLTDGYDSMLVWVLEENHPARQFYESLGGKQVGRKTILSGNPDVIEVSYGWTDIGDLAGRHSSNA